MGGDWGLGWVGGGIGGWGGWGGGGGGGGGGLAICWDHAAHELGFGTQPEDEERGLRLRSRINDGGCV